MADKANGANEKNTPGEAHTPHMPYMPYPMPGKANKVNEANKADKKWIMSLSSLHLGGRVVSRARRIRPLENIGDGFDFAEQCGLCLVIELSFADVAVEFA